MATHTQDFIGAECLEIDEINVGAFWRIINIYFTIPTTLRIVRFKNNLAPTIQDGHMKTLRIESGGKYWRKNVIERITIWGKRIWDVINDAAFDLNLNLTFIGTPFTTFDMKRYVIILIFYKRVSVIEF